MNRIVKIVIALGILGTASFLSDHLLTVLSLASFFFSDEYRRWQIRQAKETAQAVTTASKEDVMSNAEILPTHYSQWDEVL